MDWARVKADEYYADTTGRNRPDGTAYSWTDMYLGFLGEWWCYIGWGQALPTHVVSWSYDIILDDKNDEKKKYNIKTSCYNNININIDQEKRHCENYIGVRIFGDKNNIKIGDKMMLLGTLEHTKILHNNNNWKRTKDGSNYWAIPHTAFRSL